MQNDIKNWKLLYWLIIFSLLLIPLSKSFVVGLKKVIDSYVVYNKQKQNLTNLYYENRKLRSKMKQYQTEDGVKALTKDRLNKVDEGESIIRYD